MNTNMQEPVWEQNRPGDGEIQHLWQSPVFSPVACSSDAVSELLHELRTTHVNGGAEFAQFVFAGHPVLHWFVSRDRFAEIGFFENLLTSSACRSALPTLKPPTSLEPVDWERLSPYVLDGDFAGVLMAGGAYKRFNGTSCAAKALAGRVCEDLLDGRYEETEVFRTRVPWSPWFCGVAWDTTWIGVDKGRSRTWVLCATDTD